MESLHYRWCRRLCPAAFMIWLAVVATSLPGRALAVPAEDAGITIEELTEEVRANEDLYRDIEFKIHVHYKLAPDAPRISHWLDGYDRDAWVVYQGDRLFFKDEDMQHRVDGESKLIDTIQGYDGKETRQVEQRDIANIHDDRYEDPRLIRPHTLLLGPEMHVVFPLSTLLRGTEAIRTSAGAKLFERTEVRSRVLGREVVGGLDCYKVLVETATHQSTRTYEGGLRLWLARDRNLLPVKLEKLEKLPTVMARVDELREVGPGVWLPARASVTHYNAALSKKAGRLVLAHETHYELVEARLHPNYPDSFFRDVPIPDGMTVYELRGGKIVKSYIQGGEKGKQSGRLWRWLVPVGLVGLGGSAIAAIRHRRRAHVVADEG